jgi:hypothetical protein
MKTQSVKLWIRTRPGRNGRLYYGGIIIGEGRFAKRIYDCEAFASHVDALRMAERTREEYLRGEIK